MATTILARSSVFTGQALIASRHARSSRKAHRCTPRAAFELPPLPYAKDALEPLMSAETFDYHWGKHHQTYITNLNNQIKGKDLEKKSLEEVVVATWNSGKPTPEFNNAAQAWNHTFFWETMGPNGGEPTGDLKSAIEASFGSVDEFKKQLKTAGATQFGSGWAWLVVDGPGKLSITKTPNAETPIAEGKTPILTVDVWEHAYYIDARNARPKYLDNVVDKLINWKKVSERYAAAL